MSEVENARCETCPNAPLPDEVIDEIIAGVSGKTGRLLTVLEEIQKRHPAKYLPMETLETVARKLGAAPSQVYSVATFYSFFSLKPQEDHTLMICRGTACHTRGAKLLLDRLKEMSPTRIPDDEESFTLDNPRITIRAVACIGQCALAPAAVLDERVIGHLTELEVRKLLQEVEDEGVSA